MPAVRSVRVAEEDRPQLIGRGAEQCRPVTGEGVVEELGESQAVAPEPHRGLDVGGDYRRVVDSWHADDSFRVECDLSSTRASISTNLVPLYGNWVTTFPFGWR